MFQYDLLNFERKNDTLKLSRGYKLLYVMWRKVNFWFGFWSTVNVCTNSNDVDLGAIIYCIR